MSLFLRSCAGMWLLIFSTAGSCGQIEIGQTNGGAFSFSVELSPTEMNRFTFLVRDAEGKICSLRYTHFSASGFTGKQSIQDSRKNHSYELHPDTIFQISGTGMVICQSNTPPVSGAFDAFTPKSGNLHITIPLIVSNYATRHGWDRNSYQYRDVIDFGVLRVGETKRFTGFSAPPAGSDLFINGVSSSASLISIDGGGIANIAVEHGSLWVTGLKAGIVNTSVELRLELE
ncbi:hypothetical protein ED28_00145 [[Pantoea] beijingensis]|uniref:Lipoprotein n=1 Tax=[Pantoea] beijingensis TaxID=1324864 RepID=A0A443IHF1_9GAMM|nr:hypothetical protein [[Pantoea] beijingensis]RWR03432.1 hypothetical protein ED28_00145 [[Pantoea] beijingensis]